MTYEEYRDLTAALVEQGRTTGPEQTDELIAYTKLNKARMDRIDKQMLVDPELQKLLLQTKEQTWLVLSEAWCGDAAQNLPVLSAMANSTPKIFLHVALRDQHLDLMDKYLTNGGRSIPKLIAFSTDTGDELFQWGPRPMHGQQMVLDRKALPESEQLPYEQFTTELHKWYAKDKGNSVQQEFVELLKGL